jgi:hypothetical protein
MTYFILSRFVFIFLFVLAVVPVAAHAETHASVLRWVDVDHGTRAAIVAAWLALPEGTRPPFPIFRDAQLGVRQNKNNAKR